MPFEKLELLPGPPLPTSSSTPQEPGLRERAHGIVRTAWDKFQALRHGSLPEVRLDFAPESTEPDYVRPRGDKQLNLHAHLAKQFLHEKDAAHALLQLDASRAQLFVPDLEFHPQAGNFMEIMRRITLLFLFHVQNLGEDAFRASRQLRNAAIHVVNAALRFWKNKFNDELRDMLTKTGHWVTSFRSGAAVP